MEIYEQIRKKWSGALADRFKVSAEKINASVYTISDGLKIEQTISKYAKGGKIRVYVEDSLAELTASLLQKGIDASSTSVNCDISVTRALFGIADTGSIVMETTDKKLRRHTALVIAHLVILSPKMIVPTLYNAFELINQMSSEKENCHYSIISGPSRTADIERVLTLGVHGPEKLDIFIWDLQSIK